MQLEMAADYFSRLRSCRWQQQIASIGYEAVKAASLPFTADLPTGFSVLSLNNRSYCRRRISNFLGIRSCMSGTTVLLEACWVMENLHICLFAVDDPNGRFRLLKVRNQNHLKHRINFFCQKCTTQDPLKTLFCYYHFTFPH